MRSISLFGFFEKSQRFLQRGCAARASSYVFREYRKALICFLSPFSYNRFGVGPHPFVILRLYFMMYCYKSHEQVMHRCFWGAVQSLVLLVSGKQYDERSPAITTFSEMYNQLLLL